MKVHGPFIHPGLAGTADPAVEMDAGSITWTRADNLVTVWLTTENERGTRMVATLRMEPGEAIEFAQRLTRTVEGLPATAAGHDLAYRVRAR